LDLIHGTVVFENVYSQVVIIFMASVMLRVPVMNGFSCDWLRTPVPSVASITIVTIEKAVARN